MKIEGFQKLTLQDYPDVISCILFTKGCNFRCPFCHNSALVIDTSLDNLISEEEIFKYLEKRKGILDGVVVSGGEPLIQKDIKEFITKIKKLGYKVKLDTNGNNYLVLKDLIDNHLVDYVAMDIKNTFSKYDLIAGVKVNIENIKKSIQLLKTHVVDFEFRTTIVKEFHDYEDICEILKIVNGERYFLQNFEDSGSVIVSGLHGFTEKELMTLNRRLENNFQNFKIRNL